MFQHLPSRDSDGGSIYYDQRPNGEIVRIHCNSIYDAQSYVPRDSEREILSDASRPEIRDSLFDSVSGLSASHRPTWYQQELIDEGEESKEERKDEAPHEEVRRLESNIAVQDAHSDARDPNGNIPVASKILQRTRGRRREHRRRILYHGANAR